MSIAETTVTLSTPTTLVELAAVAETTAQLDGVAETVVNLASDETIVQLATPGETVVEICL
jgi:hypothetical protein